MTRQPKKPAKMPKPVEAWACAPSAAGYASTFWDHSEWVTYMIDNGINPRAFRVEVRIVPVKPKKRRVRKEKQK